MAALAPCPLPNSVPPCWSGILYYALTVLVAGDSIPWQQIKYGIHFTQSNTKNVLATQVENLRFMSIRL
ncbi:hypothetical protein XELAEV_18018416mg [Xenopus laevis]|uniref:Uncharacterized protein n=1 Tax=Xenopus laevis TaxID=8355 RepID=A0A974DDK7_XENLA|nr:hypothetical protein XELAEV_18018416mg [Xenopus laevis]